MPLIECITIGAASAAMWSIARMLLPPFIVKLPSHVHIINHSSGVLHDSITTSYTHDVKTHEYITKGLGGFTVTNTVNGTNHVVTKIYKLREIKLADTGELFY